MTETDQIQNESSVINRACAKRRLKELAKAERYYFTTFEPRVSSSTLDDLEAACEAWMRAHVQKLPSKGKTI